MKVGEILEPDIQRPWFGFHALKVVLVENLPIFGVYFHRWVLSNNIRCVFLNIQTKKTNLNEGVGKLCAGHVNVTEFSTFLMIPLKCTSSENFGFWPPMGSNFYGNIIFHWELKKTIYMYVQEIFSAQILGFKLKFYTQFFFKKQHLKEGCGNPWAGQAKAIASFVILMIFLKWESSDICGLLPPIGSNM